MSEEMEIRVDRLERLLLKLQESLIKTNNSLIAVQDRLLREAAPPSPEEP